MTNAEEMACPVCDNWTAVDIVPCAECRENGITAISDEVAMNLVNGLLDSHPCGADCFDQLREAAVTEGVADERNRLAAWLETFAASWAHHTVVGGVLSGVPARIRNGEHVTAGDHKELDALPDWVQLKLDEAVAAERERLAAWMEEGLRNTVGLKVSGCCSVLISLFIAGIRNGEHVAAIGPPTARPLDALQVAAVKAYLAKGYVCSCSDKHLDPECSMHCNDIENAVNEICDGTFLEFVAASGGDGACT